MRIAVTGSGGYLGGHLVRELEQHGHQVLRVDRHGSPRRDAFQLHNILAQNPCDVVVHCAAEVGRLLCDDTPLQAVHGNAELTTAVALAAHHHGARLVYVSTSEVYGDHGDSWVSELSACEPLNIYGLSKLWGEQVSQLYAPDGLLIVRPIMTYGLGLPHGRGRAAIVNFLEWARTGQPITVHKGTERSWCWIGDIVKAFRHLIEKGAEGVYNIGRDDDQRSMLEVARLACELADQPVTLIREEPLPPRVTAIKRQSTRKLYATDWLPRVDLEEGMCLLLDALARQEAAA